MQLPPFRLERYFARYEFSTQFLLCSSDCESMPIRDLLALEPEAAERFLDLRLGYTESPGAPTLRREIARLYTTIEPEQVLVHSGAEEAIFLFMHAALKAGDHLVVHAPGYQSLAEVARGIGCAVTPWRADESDGWALDPEALRKALRPATRAIVLNTPHNPTGYLMRRDLFQEVHRIAEERGLLLLSDEVYRESEHDPSARLPAACDLGRQAVSLGVMSKTYGLPGLRIGWIATRNAELVARMQVLKDYTTICNSAPGEFLAELALRHRQRLAGRNLALIARNLAIVEALFARHADRFAWVRPQAGPIAFPRLIGGEVEAFCHDLVTTANVLLMPGTVYEEGSSHFRIGFGRADLPEAVARLEAFLRTRRR